MRLEMFDLNLLVELEALLVLVGMPWVAVMQTRFADYFTTYFPLRSAPCPLTIPPTRHIVQWHRSNAAERWLGESAQRG